MRWLRFSVFMLGTLLLIPQFAHGQAASATLVGTVKDASGAVLPGVTVTTRNAETGEVRTTVTAHDGAFRVSNVPRGR